MFHVHLYYMCNVLGYQICSLPQLLKPTSLQLSGLPLSMRPMMTPGKTTKFLGGILSRSLHQKLQLWGGFVVARWSPAPLPSRAWFRTNTMPRGEPNYIQFYFLRRQRGATSLKPLYNSQESARLCTCFCHHHVALPFSGELPSLAWLQRTRFPSSGRGNAATSWPIHLGSMKHSHSGPSLGTNLPWQLLATKHSSQYHIRL